MPEKLFDSYVELYKELNGLEPPNPINNLYGDIFEPEEIVAILRGLIRSKKPNILTIRGHAPTPVRVYSDYIYSGTYSYSTSSRI